VVGQQAPDHSASADDKGQDGGFVGDGGSIGLRVMVGSQMLQLNQSNDRSASAYKSGPLGRLTGFSDGWRPLAGELPEKSGFEQLPSGIPATKGKPSVIPELRGPFRPLSVRNFVS
jgi:hypothetical protein